MKKSIKFPTRYLPSILSKKDKTNQIKMLMKTRKMYKKNMYYKRQPLSSYKSKPSNHISNARKCVWPTTARPDVRTTATSTRLLFRLATTHEQSEQPHEGNRTAATARPQLTAEPSQVYAAA